MLEGKGKYWKSNGKLYIYIPFAVATDSAFPFKGEKGHLRIKIEGEKLLVEEYPEEC